MLNLDLQDEPEYLDDYEPLSCRDCGSTYVHWEQVNDKWVLVNDDSGKIHFC